MAVVKAALTNTKRAFSRSCIPLIPVQENGSATRIFPKSSDGRIKLFAVMAVVVGLSTSTFCSRQLSSEKKDCNPLKRLFSTVSKPSEDHHVIVDKGKGYRVSVGVKD